MKPFALFVLVLLIGPSSVNAQDGVAQERLMKRVNDRDVVEAKDPETAAAEELEAQEAAAPKKSPVTRIVNLLTVLKADTEALGKKEQQIYDKYACWCEKTSKRKADDIVQAQADLRALGQRILKLKGKIATLTAEIQELTEKIEANEDEQEKITALRQKRNADFMAESDEVKQAMAALQSAIKVLTDATIKDDKGAAMIQENARVRMKYAIRDVLDKLPSTVSPHMPSERISLLSEFTKDTSKYAPQSATIQGMLADMYLTFARNLQVDTQTEADQNRKYEDLYASLEEENNKMKTIRAKKEVEKAKAEAMLADTTKAYEDTEKQMHADMEFFDQTKKACQSKHEEWTTRKELREEELEGIDKALALLTSDEARELFAKSIKPGVESFLQVASSPGSSLLQGDSQAPMVKAYNAVKAQAKKAHSFRLAALAVQIRTAKFGHFEDVIKAIDEMIVTLKEEAAADLAKKTQCLDEYQDIDKTVADLEWKIKNNLAEIEKLQGLIELREKQKADAIHKKGETEDYVKQVTEERKEEHEAYEEAKKDDEAAIKLLKAAKKVFSKYYKENDIKMGPVQGSVKGAFAQEEPDKEGPAFERSADDAPDATFVHKGHNKLQSKDIISLFDYVIEDLHDEITNENKAEAKSQAEFEEERDAALTLIADLEEKIVTLEGLIADRKEDKEEETKDMKQNNRLRDDELAYEAKITPDCDWILKAFDQRAVARAAEENGLMVAKDYLAGMKAPQLLQQYRKFDDAKLSSIGFLKLSK